MNTQIRTLITDIKAAARIGHAESLWVALDGLLDLPQVSGNPPMNEPFIEKVVLPIGEALAAPRLNINIIRPLMDEPQAALRACVAASLANRYFADEDITLKELSKPGKDPRQDVRLALRAALAAGGQEQPEKLELLVNEWIASPSPRLQAIAIGLYPLLPTQALEAFSQLETPSAPEVRAAMVEALTTLAQAGQAEGVLDLLSFWAQNQDNNIWTICKTLAGSWAALHPQQAMAILLHLQPKADNPKQLINTIQALYRHGAEEEVISTLKNWQDTGDPPLRDLAKHLLNKIER
jgi:hypothetical protein